MTFTADYTLGIKRYIAGVEDAHGNPVDSWSDPDFIDVISIAPATSSEPFQAGREAVVVGLTVLAPPDTEISPRDKAVWQGEEYTIEGEIADWTHGPFDWEPGISFSLRRVNG